MKYYVERVTSYSGYDGLGACEPDSWEFENGTEAWEFYNEITSYEELQHLFLDGYDSVSSIHHKNRVVQISIIAETFYDMVCQRVQWDYTNAKEYEERNS